MFKKVEESMSMLRKDTEDIKTDTDRTNGDEKYNVYNKKYTR